MGLRLAAPTLCRKHKGGKSLSMGKQMTGRGRLRLYHFLLLVPFVSLWVPFFNRATPALGGIPFFYWYQMAWIVITSVLIWIVHRLDRRARHD